MAIYVWSWNCFFAFFRLNINSMSHNVMSFWSSWFCCSVNSLCCVLHKFDQGCFKTKRECGKERINERLNMDLYYFIDKVYGGKFYPHILAKKPGKPLGTLFSVGLVLP